MKMPHTLFHWILVALVAGALLLAFSEARGQAPGQSSGAAGVFQGRPSMAGAQGGLGAQAGLPQGGIGLQGSEGAEIKIPLGSAGSQDQASTPATGTGTVSVGDLKPVANDTGVTPGGQGGAAKDPGRTPAK